MLSAHRGVKSRSSLEYAATSTDDESAAAPLVVLPSSTELFYFYAQSLESCATLAAGSDKILLDLAKVHGKWLKIYAGQLSFDQYYSIQCSSPLFRGCSHHQPEEVSDHHSLIYFHN
jgi:hypothetical protein